MKHVARVVFWLLFLPAAGFAFAYYWNKNDPMLHHPDLLELRTRYNILLLAHPHPEVASAAWITLWNLFHRKWQVYHALPAHFADGVALAHRGRLPLRMADEDLGRVPLTPLAASEAPAQIEPPPTSGPSRQSARPPEAFRALIESLDFDNFGPRPGEDHSSGASNAA